MKKQNANSEPKKSESEDSNGHLGTISVVDGKSAIRFRGDIAWDIETCPLKADSDDGSLLDPKTARVMVIAYYEPGANRFVMVYDQDEAAVLKQFWDIFLAQNSSGRKLVGFNSANFDLPFVIRRSWYHGVRVPANIYGWGRSFCDTFVDLLVAWRCGQFKEFISLHVLSQFLNVGEKTGSGERFWKLWQTDQEAALQYVCNDVYITERCADRMGVMANSA